MRRPPPLGPLLLSSTSSPPPRSWSFKMVNPRLLSHLRLLLTARTAATHPQCQPHSSPTEFQTSSQITDSIYGRWMQSGWSRLTDTALLLSVLPLGPQLNKQFNFPVHQRNMVCDGQQLLGLIPLRRLWILKLQAAAVEGWWLLQCNLSEIRQQEDPPQNQRQLNRKTEEECNSK